METYGLYFYNSHEAYIKTKRNILTPAPILQSGLTKIKNIDISTFQKSCVDSLKMSILIQHLKNAETLHKLLEKPSFIKDDLLYILFQVYAPLTSLMTIFTHYDLHTQNVLLYEPVQNSYIEYHYHTIDGQSLTFKSKYIAKIIDYGHSYFNDKTETDVTMSSEKIHKELCKLPQCPNCGKEQGFKLLNGTPDEYNVFTSSRFRNISHDLRLVDFIKIVYGPQIKRYNPSVYKILENVKYGQGITDPNMKLFGTKENIKRGFPDINNLLDIWKYLSGTILQVPRREENEQTYAGLTKLGDLHVYLNTTKPMEFIPEK